MPLTADKVQINKYNYSYWNRRPSSVQIKQRKNNSGKIMTGLACLAAIGIAYTGIKKLSPDILSKLTNHSRKAAQEPLFNITSRGKDGVQAYKAFIAGKKAYSLKYKIENGLLQGKSQDAVSNISNNLNNLLKIASQA